ncbi:MAG: alpha/beta fold hydrolase [Candidatus Thorarchaeota archaeon]
MNRRVLYLSLLILSIITASSLYLSWSADTGLGDLVVERMEIESDAGRPVNFLVYSPRYLTYGQPMPIVLTTHGIAGSKEGMYSFNIELARRNFTVISVDLAGHGDSELSFDWTDYATLADDCYAALRYIQTTRAHVDHQLYGILTHSLGLQVALAVNELAIKPYAFAAVGYLGDIDIRDTVIFPGNFLLALGEFDEMISTDDALEALRRATGNDSAVAGVTYGSFENQTAYKLALAPTEHVFEALDATIVAESVLWLVQALQGESQVNRTLPMYEQVYQYKVIATATAPLGLLVSTIPLMFAIYYALPESLKPRKIPNNSTVFPIKKTVIYGSVVGAAMILLFAASCAASFHLESADSAWISSMFGSGQMLFLGLGVLVLPSTMMLLIGKENTILALAAVGIERTSPKEKFTAFLKVALVGGACIAWLLGWIMVGGLPESMTPWIAIALVKTPAGVRAFNMLVLFLLGIPYFAVEAAWIRGIMLSKRDWGGKREFTKNMGLAFITRIAVAGVLAIAITSATTLLGLIAGPMVLLGLLLLLFMIVSMLTTLLISWASLEMENPWPAVILSAFLWAWVAISSTPII